jgi:hypothetical protein
MIAGGRKEASLVFPQVSLRYLAQMKTRIASAFS